MPLAIGEDAVYGIKDNGTVFARETKTGKEIWSTRLDSEVEVPPSVAGKTLLVGTVDGDLLGIDTDTGDIVWTFKIGSEITSSPIVSNRTIYVGAKDGSLYAVTGEAN